MTLPDEAGQTMTAYIYKLDPLARRPTCLLRLYECRSPAIYRIAFFGEGRSYFFCREHMRETAVILGADLPD